MRTYTRKRPEYQVIEGVQNLCRLCLEKSQTVIPIFTNDSDNVYATLSLRIMICVGLEITREDCLPNIICVNCHEELERYYAFRKKCEVTYQKLKSHLLAVREQKVKKTEVKEKNGNKIKIENNVDDHMLVMAYAEDQQIEDINNIGDKIIIQRHETNTDIASFLSSVLIDLGILEQQDNTLAIVDNTKNVELLTEEGEELTLELEEVDEEEETVPNSSTLKPVKVEADVTPQKDVAFKYITASDNSDDTENSNVNQLKNDDGGGGGSDGGLWCGRCARWFCSAGAARRHIRSHAGLRPHACRDCGRRFAQRSVMLRHLLVHQPVRPFACSWCDKSFTQRAALASHARTHAPPPARALALHRCLRCPKLFLYASGLSRHMMVHKGRVFVCGSCSRRFTDKSSLQRHLNNTNHRAPAPGNQPA